MRVDAIAKEAVAMTSVVRIEASLKAVGASWDFVRISGLAGWAIS